MNMAGRTTMSCEEYYGPYPEDLPIPFLSSTNEGRDGEAPSKDEIDKARTMFDLPRDYRDVGTPDEWIPRDGRMVRLTGKHPFNAETPLDLLDSFITPTNFHVVRNHSKVPKLSWDTHTLCIGGPLVTTPLELSMDELVNTMPSREFPVTLSCCGNRRKEMNLIKQTIGFSWGAGGVGTNVYKGVPVRDLLIAAGVSEQDMNDKYVEFVGYEDLPNKFGKGPFEDEPWGKTVKYGTSIPLGRAMSPAFDVMVAYEANGKRLHPDHGFPVRVIIPGYIGGRMVKWLEKINVIPHESKNHYHYHDNKYMPPFVTAELADKEDSVDKSVTVGGYAHAGGGRKVTRVEVSLDHGVTWGVSAINRKERPNAFGMHWCWIWWKFQVKGADLVGCKEIWCRAWDDCNSPQPECPTWSLMGQNANHIFRVKVHADQTADGQHVLRFEHPTQPGQQSGGWATRPADKYQSAGYGVIEMTQ